jgi:hypothetical protein
VPGSRPGPASAPATHCRETGELGVEGSDHRVGELADVQALEPGTEAKVRRGGCHTSDVSSFEESRYDRAVLEGNLKTQTLLFPDLEGLNASSPVGSGLIVLSLESTNRPDVRPQNET